MGDKLIIGKFCAIAQGIEFIMNGANHRMNSVTTYPFNIMGSGWEKATPALEDLPFYAKEKYKMQYSQLIFTQVIARPKRKLILIRGKNATHYFEFCDEVGCDIWGKLLNIKDALYEPIGMWMTIIFLVSRRNKMLYC